MSENMDPVDTAVVKQVGSLDGNNLKTAFGSVNHNTYDSGKQSVNTITNFRGNIYGESSTDMIRAHIENNPSRRTTKSRNNTLGKAPLFCSRRLVLSVVSCFGMVNLYTLRFNLNFAMTWMVNNNAVAEMKRTELETVPNQTSYLQTTCDYISPDTLTFINTRNPKKTFILDIEKGEFIWPAHVQTLMLSSFFMGYLTTQILGGWLAERYGGKLFFGLCILACAIASLFIPIAARTDYRILIFIRVLLGIFQGVAWPSMFVIWSRWAPPQEKQKLTSLTYAGSFLGVVITLIAVSLLCEDDGPGWPSVFYITGILGILWYFIWLYCVFDSPEVHPRILDNEMVYLRRCLRKNISLSLKDHRSTPWKQLMTSRPAWALMATHTGANITLYALIDNLPKYMMQVLYFEKYETGLITALPYIGIALVSIISGILYDNFTTKRKYSPTLVRKVGNAIGTSLPAIFIFAVSYLNCENRVVVVLLLIICISLCGFQYGAGFLNNFTDLAPQHVGVFFGISNTFATISGITAPFLIRSITSDKRTSSWQTVLRMMAGAFVFDTIIFSSFGSAEIQEWAQLPVDNDDDNDIDIFENDKKLHDEST